MISLRKSVKIAICCFESQKDSIWYDELKNSGISVFRVLPQFEKQWTFNSKAIVLIQPDYDQFSLQQYKRVQDLLENQTDYVFVVSSDDRWKGISPINHCFFINIQTHPLELARLLVEKLNLSTTINSSHHAFSIFSL